jgi:hypothetical protein
VLGRGGGGTDKAREEADAKLRERGGGMAMGSFMLGVVGRNLLMEGVDGKGGNKDERLVEIVVVARWRNEMRGIDAVQRE